MMRARTLGTIQRISGQASDQAPYRVLKVAPPHGAPICHRCGLFRGYTPDLGEAMMRARTLGTIQRLSGHASDQAPYRVLKVAPPMGHRSATVVVYFAGTHLTWGMRVLGQWTWAVGYWAFYLTF